MRPYSRISEGCIAVLGTVPEVAAVLGEYQICSRGLAVSFLLGFVQLLIGRNSGPYSRRNSHFQQAVQQVLFTVHWGLCQ